MKRSIALIAIAGVAGIAILGISPGCDELITNESHDTFYVYDTILDSTCLELCHSDINTIMEVAVRQWENSGHASAELFNNIILDKNALTCGPECHTREGFVQSIVGGSADLSHPTEIGCFACHAPHTTWDFSLRDSSAVTLVNGTIYDYGKSNLCVRCHHSIDSTEVLIKDNVAVGDYWNSWVKLVEHGSSEAEMLTATGGYLYSDTTAASHSTTADMACITCHQEMDSLFTMGGHSLNFRYESAILDKTCNRSECHSSTYVITAAFVNSRQSIYTNSVNALRGALVEDSLLDDATGLPFIDLVIPDSGSAGALYNYFFLANDKSKGMHNWDYAMLLIGSSLDFLAGGGAQPGK